MSTPAIEPAPARPKRKYIPAVGPRLRWLLLTVFALVAVLGANSVYLSSITFLEWKTGLTYQNYFYQTMFLGHLGLGLLLVAPLVIFGVIHMLNTRHRKNRRAIRIGYALFAASIIVLATGLGLMRVGGLELRQPAVRSVVYWLHVICPLAAGWLYWLHRLTGPKIRWRLGLAYAAAVGAAVLAMISMHKQDPRKWNVVGPVEGEKYFFPSLARTSTGNFIPAKTLMMDDYCMKCHQDVYDGWYHSVHRLSSFNNPAYLASVRETREVSLKRDGDVRASRWCAGCHDPVPFFSGAFDDPKFDDVNHPTSQAGITCTVCHAVTNVNTTRGNADYTIEEPLHYPFAQSENPVLQYINEQLVKAKPAFHKKTFLKPFHTTAEFCSSCHKVHLPLALNHYKEFLRGQNHYDPYLLSGVSGHGARSFYYPPKAVSNCAGCHMPAVASGDFGAKLIGDSKELSIHNHLFPAANTGVAWLKNDPETIKAHQEFMKANMRIDIFGIKEGGSIDGKLIAPLRPEVPTLKRGEKYLLELVLRTLKLGHLFTQGTVDSNEVWVEVTVTSGGKEIGRTGRIDERGEVDPWSHFVNVFMLDRDGNRIDRRNPQDIFVPLYNHQIPPGAGQVVHYALAVPDDAGGSITIEAKLQYRKFDQRYMEFVTRSAKPGDNPIRGYEPGGTYTNELPVTTLAVDKVTLPVEGGDPVENPIVDFPLWQRWNDYGIGLLLEGQGGAKGELRQAADAFAEVEKLGRFDGPLNLARVYNAEGRLDEAVAALDRARSSKDPPAPHWTLAWLTGLVNRQEGNLEAAAENLRSVLETVTSEMRERKFDFSLDYEVINELGQVLFDQAKQLRGDKNRPERDRLVREAIERFEKTLSLDSENVTAHYNLQLLYSQLGDEKLASEHAELHAKYKPDDNARDRAVALARQKYPAADHAAEALVIYDLQRKDNPAATDSVDNRRVENTDE